ATFFVVGSEVEKYPELVAQMVKDGHELGNHTFSHVNLSRVSPERGWRELAATDRLLRRVDPRFRGIFRPPWVRLGVVGALYAARYGRPAVMWTLDSRDHALRDARLIL